MIVESQLDRAHSLGTEGKSAEALQVVDEILALDEANPSAISLKMQLDAGSPPVVYDRTALLRRLFGTTEQPHFAERVAVLIAELVEHDEFETATTLLDALLAFDPSFEIGRQMCAVLDDDSLDAAAKKAAIAKLAEQARQRVIDSVEMELRNARIRDVVDPSLHMFAFGTGLPDTNDGLYDGPIPPAEMATVIGTGVRVTVLVRGINDDLLGTIRELGFKVEDTSREFKLIVGLAPFGRLDDLAVLAAVRRIEPTRVVIYETADQRR